MKAVILCGGFGSRLRGVIGGTQKAVAEVDGRPFLHIVVERLGAAGFDELIFCTHYQSDQVAMALDALGESVAHKTTILQEQEPLGTGGAILNAMEVLGMKGDFIALNSDTYVTAEAYRLAHESTPPSLIVRGVEDCARYGAVRLDDSGNIIEMTEKGVSGPGCISMGIYHFHTDHLAGFPVTACSMEKDILPQLIQMGLLKGIRYSGDFIDIGTPESLATIREKGFTNFP